jgi:hypothetical protein
MLLCFSCLMLCSIPLVQPIVPLLLFDLLFHSSCSTCYSMFSVVFGSSCSACCFAFLVWPIVPLLLLDLLLCSSYSTCCFSFNMVFHFFCSTCCFTFLVWLVTLFILFNLLFCSFCSTSCSTLLFLLLLFQISIFPPLFFCKHGVWKSYPNLSSSNQTWKVRVFVFNLCLLMDFFNYYFFLEMVVDNVFVCCVQELFEHCRFNYTHCNSLLRIAFHLHNCITYFFSTLHLCFPFQLLVNV